MDGVDDIDDGCDGCDGPGRMTSADATEDTSFSSVFEWTYNTPGKVETD